MTLSALVDGQLYTASDTLKYGTNSCVVQNTPVGLFALFFDDHKCEVNFQLSGAAGTLQAAKLELGPVQTLARQDASGNWVLNDPPPNPALELTKCQRYLARFSQYNVFVCTQTGDAYSDFLVWLPGPMRSTPTLTGGENLKLKNPAVAWYNGYTNQLLLRSEDTNYAGGSVMCAGPIYFSCEL